MYHSCLLNWYLLYEHTSFVPPMFMFQSEVYSNYPICLLKNKGMKLLISYRVTFKQLGDAGDIWS